MFLGFGPEGETLDDDNLPIRWAEEFRALGDAPTALAGFDSGDWDTRTQHVKEAIQGPEPREIQDIYTDDAQDIPMIHWWEMRLIEAMDEAVNGSAQNAIDLINEIREDAFGNTDHNITGAYETDLSDGTLANGTTIREVVFEEARRALYAKAGRFWAWKLANLDLSFFPRSQGTTPFQGYQLQGGVKLQFPDDEYELNPEFDALGNLDARGTLCAPNEQPRLS